MVVKSTRYEWWGPNEHLIFMVKHPSRLGRPLHPGDSATFLDLDANGAIKLIQIEREVHVLRM